MKNTRIDRQQLLNLKDLEDALGEQILLEMSTLYELDYNDSINHMIKHLNNKDFENLSKYAHKLKSPSGNLGMVKIYKHCLDMEREGKKLNKTFPYQQCLDDIEQEWVFFKNLFRIWNYKIPQDVLSIDIFGEKD